MNMNSLNLRLKYSYVRNLIKLSWSDIKFLIDEEYFDETAAIEHAYNVLEYEENSFNNDSIISLASLLKKQTIHPFIDILEQTDAENNKLLIREKSLYIILSWLYLNRNNYEDPLEMIEIVYADFEYPKDDMKELVRYLPAEDPENVGVEKIYANWVAYLKKKREKFSSTL